MQRAVITLLTLTLSVPVFGADLGELAVSMIGGSSRGFGSLTPTDWRLHEGRGAEARLTIFLPGSLSASVDVGKQRIESRAAGVTEASHAVSQAVMLDWYGGALGRAVPYLGAGVSYLRYGQAHPTAEGQLTQPDHAAFMTEAGVKYLLSPKWRFNTGVRFGPARSTAEVMHANGTVEHIDFHQFYVSAGIGYAF
ncbi:MAG TPA: OmpW family outer membrane protein [Thermoanaerobaculia bacterium]|nr:OmpW family outer membrane protein [Thermoanaerobaculia bacterium]